MENLLQQSPLWVLYKGPQGEIKQGSEILYHGDNILNYNKKQWQAYKGGEVAIIFQDALASLNQPCVLESRSWKI